MTRGELLERAAASTFEVMFKGYTLGQCECGSEHCDEYKCECACPGCPNLVAEWTRTAEAGLRSRSARLTVRAPSAATVLRASNRLPLLPPR